MKKRWIALAGMAALVIGAFAACGNEADIGRDKALETALEDAGVTEENATRLQVSEDRDDGRKVYDVRFDVEDTAYDYEIQASDGTILSSETERISGNATGSGDDGTSQNTAETQNQSQTTQGPEWKRSYSFCCHQRGAGDADRAGAGARSDDERYPDGT